MRFYLDVDDAIVTVYRRESGLWQWAFMWLDGSHNFNDTDWAPTVRSVKIEAKVHYERKTGNFIKRAKWIKK